MFFLAKKNTQTKALTVKRNGTVKRNANPATGLDLTDQYQYSMGRYVDPLILYKIHNKANAEMREVVAEADPIASVLTHHFAESANTKMIKFYESDQLGSPEILQDFRSMLKLFKFQEHCKMVMLRGQTHGWYIVYPFVDENGIPLCEIYSEYECKAEYINYDLQNNIQTYLVQFIPRVGFSRNTHLRQVRRMFQKDQVIHGTRGTWCYGFGHSILEAAWDAITKLREESHTNAFKQKIMPFVRVPDNWEDSQIEDFMKALSKIDQMSALVMKGHINENTGEYTDLPAITWATPANQTPAKQSQGSGGSVSDLSSEWSRLTGSTRRSVAYFVGGGAISASLSAAAVDSLDDVQADISDFNQYIDEFIVPFCKWFAEAIGYKLPETFTVKGWWEWTRDEAVYNQQLQTQQQLKQDAETQIEDAQKEKRNSYILEYIKDQASKADLTPFDRELQARLNQRMNESTKHPDQILMSVITEITHEALNNSVQTELSNCIKQNMNMPMQVVASSTVKGVGLQGSKLLVEFHSGTKYKGAKYAYELGDNAEQAWSDMLQSTSKGGYVWDNLRGTQIGPAWGTGNPTPGGTTASLVPYEKTGRLGPGYMAGSRQEYEKQAAESKEFKEESLGADGKALGSKRYAYPEERGFESGQPSEFYTEEQMYGGQGPQTGTPSISSDNTTANPAQSELSITDYQGIGDNLSTNTPKKEAYTAEFVWGSSKNPQGYAQRPKGMKTKTEAKTTGVGFDSTIDGNFPSFFNSSVMNRRNIGIQIEKLEDLPPAVFIHPLLQEHNSISGMRKNLHIGYETAHKLLEQDDLNVTRCNLAAVSTAMHTANPFLYKVEGGYRAEYICPDSLRLLEGVEVPYGLWHNLDDESSAELPEWQIIGTYKVDQITGEKDLSTITYLDNWEEKANEVFTRLKETTYYQDPKVQWWVDNYIDNVKKGIHGDVSTGIVTDVKYDTKRNKWIQKNIRLKSVSAVPIGNCTRPFCMTKDKK